MGTEIWGIILLIAYLAIFVGADIFLVKFIKKGTTLSMKKSYIYSVLSFFTFIGFSQFSVLVMMGLLYARVRGDPLKMQIPIIIFAVFLP